MVEPTRAQWPDRVARPHILHPVPPTGCLPGPLRLHLAEDAARGLRMVVDRLPDHRQRAGGQFGGLHGKRSTGTSTGRAGHCLFRRQIVRAARIMRSLTRHRCLLVP
ncbi:hypothetical protein GCM10011394_05980 [Luteimonas terricola]|uniref:Uncharacterized protein n=1 Tax=Luteimonas terricola TaxID=645597 RepID=A0ABQ2E7Q0_9GAMM|nr:hypothetical protein GCM10011394_05980 [Luteimonas terricola]